MTKDVAMEPVQSAGDRKVKEVLDRIVRDWQHDKAYQEYLKELRKPYWLSDLADYRPEDSGITNGDRDDPETD